MSKALELADKLDDTPNWQKEKWGSQWKHSTLVFSRDPFEAAAELRRLAAVEARQAELLEALQNLIEAADSMKGTYTFVQGKTPEHDDHYGHEKWAEEFLQERADAASAAIAKTTGETK